MTHGTVKANNNKRPLQVNRSAAEHNSSLRRISWKTSKTVSCGKQTMSPVGHAHQFLKLTQAPDHSCVELIRKRGIDVLNDSALNKVDQSCCVFRAIISRKQHRSLSLQGTGFSLAERERLGLRGLLPPRVLSADTQVTCRTSFAADTHCAYVAKRLASVTDCSRAGGLQHRQRLSEPKRG